MKQCDLLFFSRHGSDSIAYEFFRLWVHPLMRESCIQVLHLTSRKYIYFYKSDNVDCQFIKYITKPSYADMLVQFPLNIPWKERR